MTIADRFTIVETRYMPSCAVNYAQANTRSIGLEPSSILRVAALPCADSPETRERLVIVTLETEPDCHAHPDPSFLPERIIAASAATELMDRIYRRQRYVYDATRKWFLLGRDHLLEKLLPGESDTILEIGCGTGRNLIVAARLYPNAHFFGIDVSTEMLTSARRSIACAGLSSRVHVAHADATCFDPRLLFGMRQFDRIMISYSLSMIPAWRDVLDRAVPLLASGGRLHIVDFGRMEGLPRWFTFALKAWLAHFCVTPRDALTLEMARLADCTGAMLLITHPYRGYAQYAVLTTRA
jgi:S-adenosylmethionine-diacylgycerolhomoserine-N-methlytransferase